MKGEKHRIAKTKDGRTIEVYRLANGKWCDYSNCTDEYEKKDLEFIKEKERG